MKPELLAPGVEPGIGMMLVVILALMAGAIFVMWVGELITEYGVGNGASLVIMANIIATMPASLAVVIAQQEDAYNVILTQQKVDLTNISILALADPDPSRGTVAMRTSTTPATS